MGKYIKQSIVCLGVVFSVLCVFSLNALALESKYGTVKTATVKIMTKGASWFYVTERKFIVDAKSDIRDQSNMKITLAQLPVPCIANLAFVAVSADESLCIKLNVQSLATDTKGIKE